MDKYIASVSFGKDSLAMLLKIIEQELPLDEVVFYDTGMEFEAIYNIRNKIVPFLKNRGIKYVELKPKESFLYTMFEKPVNKRNGQKTYGYSWCGGRCRWGTTAKLKAIDDYCKGSVQYVGLAFDETNRLKKERNGYKLFPLATWGMTEKDCLKYCYEKGFDWLENGVDLYSILDRVSCWCCCNKNLKELKNYYKYLPTYWSKLKDLQLRTSRPMKYNKYSVFDLEKKFSDETRKEKQIMNDRTYDYYLQKGNEVIDLGPEAHFAFMRLKLGDPKKVLDENYPDYHLKVQTPFEYEDVAQIKIDGRKFEEQFKNHKEEK